MSNEIPRCPECKQLLGAIKHGWACEKCRYIILDDPLFLRIIGEQGEFKISWFGKTQTYNDEELKELRDNPKKLFIQFPKEDEKK